MFKCLVAEKEKKADYWISKILEIISKENKKEIKTKS